MRRGAPRTLERARGRASWLRRGGTGDVGWGRLRCIMPHGSESGGEGQVRQAGIDRMLMRGGRGGKKRIPSVDI